MHWEKSRNALALPALRALVESMEARVLLSSVSLHAGHGIHFDHHIHSTVVTTPNHSKKKSPKIVIDPVYKASYSAADQDVNPIPYQGGTITPSTPGTSSTIEAINFDSQASTSGFYDIPPDNEAATGPTQVVNTVNTVIQWFTKAGTNQATKSLATFFSSLSPVNQGFDPKVIYDTYNGRFVVLADERRDISNGDSTDSSRIWLAVSKTSDPNGGFWFTQFNTDLTISGHATWLDFPTIGVDSNAIYIGGNMFTFGNDPTTPGTFESSRLFIVNKTGFYTSGTTPSVSTNDPSTSAGLGSPAFTLQPTVMYGTTPGSTGTFLINSGWSDGTNDYLSIIRVDNPITSPSFSNQFINLGNIDQRTLAFPSNVPEKGTTHTLDGGDLRVLDAVWRSNALWIVNDINPTTSYDATNAGTETAHWYKINTSTLSSLSLADQGDIGGEDIAAGTWTFYPSIAVDSSGNVGIGFSASGSNIYPSAAYTGRLAGDSAGTVEASVVYAAGVDYYYRVFGGSRNRWGDYSSISIDPSNNATFWVFNQYALARGTVLSGLPNEDGRWGTRYGSFSFLSGNISGTVFQDNNSDGTLNGSDAGLSGQTVYLDVNNNGVLDAGDISTTTGAGGAFTFAGVVVGTYTLREVVPITPISYAESTPASGSYSVTVTSGSNLTGYVFGNFPLSFTGTSGTNYQVQLDGSGHTQILVNNTVTYTAPTSIIPSLTFNLSAGNEALTVSGVNGNPVPATSGITDNGGTGDSLAIIGSSAAYSFTANNGQFLFGANAINYNSFSSISLDPKTGTDNLTVNAGTINIPAQTNGGGFLLRHFANLTIAANAAVSVGTNLSSHADRSVLLVDSNLSINSSGKLDLGGNDMIVRGTSSIGTLFSLLSSGFNSGAWTGNGIDSSYAASNVNHLTAMGLLANNTGGSTPIYTTFDGQAGLLSTDVLIKYTWYGDADLNGTVNGNDYSQIDTGFASAGAKTGWSNGDFNYDTHVDGTDYSLIDNVFNMQNGTL